MAKKYRIEASQEQLEALGIQEDINGLVGEFIKEYEFDNRILLKVKYNSSYYPPSLNKVSEYDFSIPLKYLQGVD